MSKVQQTLQCALKFLTGVVIVATLFLAGLQPGESTVNAVLYIHLCV